MHLNSPPTRRSPLTCGSPVAEFITEESWRPPDLLPEVLQTIQLNSDIGGRDLYYRVLHPPVGTADQGRVTIGIGAKVSFNTYFNSFYEHYWMSHAPLDEIALRLFGSGQVLVEWFRALPTGVHYFLDQKCVDLNSSDDDLPSVRLASNADAAGRLFFTLTALSEQATLLGGRFESKTKPRRPVRLGIGLCTFSREAAVTANLRRIVASPYFRWARPQIIVVNQGPPFRAGTITDLLEQEDRIRVIEQPNLGGAGGFTRAAIELVRESLSTHLLFMDDDIEIDPCALIVTHAFAARALKATVVGGAMLDLFRPSTMYEAGATVGRDNILQPALRDLSLDRESSLDKLAREVPVNFNGWWYCAIPAEAFRKHGLPLPIFIRGDDMEYGVRLMTKGIPTVSLPPVSVWHEPFYAKRPGWQLYYDLRNRLIFASCYPDLVRLDPPAVILRRLTDCLLKHDYAHAALALRAIDDFLSGPRIMDGRADALHAEIVAIAARNAPQRLTGLDPLEIRPRPVPRGTWMRLRILRGLIRSWFGPPPQNSVHLGLLDATKWQWSDAMDLSRYVLIESSGSFKQLYEYDRSKFRYFLMRGVKATFRYYFSYRTAAGLWRAAHTDLSSWARWDRNLQSTPAHCPHHTPTSELTHRAV